MSDNDKPNTAPSRAPLVSLAYTEMLKREVEAAPKQQNEIAEKGGFSRQTLWRAIKPNEATLKGSYALRNAINDVTNSSLPPPVVLIDDADDYAWCQAGKTLKALNYQKFLDALDEVQKLAGASCQDHEAMGSLRLLRDPAESDADDTD